MCSYSSSCAEPTSGGWSHAPEEKVFSVQCTTRQSETGRGRWRKVLENTLAMQQLSHLQDRVLIDTGVWLELTGGLALGVIDGVERLCMLCPGCRSSVRTLRYPVNTIGTHPTGGQILFCKCYNGTLSAARTGNSEGQRGSCIACSSGGAPA